MIIAVSAKLKKTLIYVLAMLLVASPLLIISEASAVAYPVKNQNTGKSYMGIQEAIDDDETDDGHTIKVNQGNTFNENLLIHKKLTIKSDNKWGTTIITQGAYRGIDIAANNVTLEGFKILLPNNNQGTAWHLKIAGQSNVTLRDVVLYGPGKNSGYSGPNNGITGIDINSSQNITLDRVFVEHYNKNGIAVTAKQGTGSVVSSDITFKDIISRANGKSDGWAGVAFYTKSSEGQMSDISNIDFIGNSKVEWNPMGIFIDGSGGVVTGAGLLDFGQAKFNNNKYDLVNAQLADAIALNAYFDGKNGVNAIPATLDYIEDQIWHNCENSPYLTGQCSGSAITYDFSTDYPTPLGSVKYAVDDLGPEVSGIVLNGQNVDTGDVRTQNCQAIKKFYTVGGEIDLKAVVSDSTSDVTSVQYKVRKVNSGGCTVSNIFSSGNVNMVNTNSDDWEDISGFDTNSVPADGEYTIFLRSKDNLNNQTTSYIDILVDNEAPDAFNVSPADNTFTTGMSITQQWGSNASDVKYYVYESYDDANGNSLRWDKSFNSTSKTANNVADAEYWWRVKAVDYAGNESDWTDLWKITVDNTAPSLLSLNFIPNNPSSTRIISGSTEPGATIEVTVQSNPQTKMITADSNGAWSLVFSDLEIGKHTATAISTDQAGNSSNPVVEIFEVIGRSNNNDSSQNSNPGDNNIAQNSGNDTSANGTSGVTQVQGAQDGNVTDNEDDEFSNDTVATATDVEGVTSATQESEEAVAASNSGFNWWWILVIIAVLAIGYGIYRFAFTEVEDN